MSLVIQGVDVHLKDQGTGTPTLLLHGNPDSSEIWNGVMARLHNYRCLAPDLPGFGQSRAPHNFDCSFANLARFLDELVEVIGLRTPLNLVAHDFGGAFGMAWAADHPEKVRRIVVINHAFFVSDYDWHFWARIWRRPVIGELSMRTMNWPLFYRMVRAGSRKLSREQIRRTYERITPETKRMILRLYRAANPEDFWEWEPRMLRVTARVPTMVLWGVDPYIPRWVADRFAAKFVKAFPESGHWVPAEEPEGVANQLLGFFGE